jgi:hypothetical protein
VVAGERLCWPWCSLSFVPFHSAIIKKIKQVRCEIN